MKKIQLTKGFEAIVDNDDYERLSAFKWCASRPGGHKKHSAVRGKNIEGKTKIIQMHREILNYDGPLVVDHINGNRLDNRKENLRICTQSQNLMNRAVKSGRKTKGTYYDKRRKHWRAAIKVDGKQKHLGVFKTENEAAKAYDIAARKFFKDYAKENGDKL